MDELIGSVEKEALLRFFAAWAGQISQDISKMINKSLTISEGTWKITSPQAIKDDYASPRMVASIELEGQPPFNILMQSQNVAVLVDIFMGGDGSGVGQDFNDIQLGIVEELFTQIGVSLSSQLSKQTGKNYKNLPPKIQSNGLNTLPNQLVEVSSQIKLNNLVNGPFVFFIGVKQAMELASLLVPKSEATNSDQANRGAEREMVAKQAKFNQLNSQNPTQKVGNIDLILDVLLQLTAVLGRTGVTIKDLVQLGPGSVLELDKLAGEAVELYANNKLVAKGEVVVIDERFAVRVTETVSPMERLQGLQNV